MRGTCDERFLGDTLYRKVKSPAGSRESVKERAQLIEGDFFGVDPKKVRLLLVERFRLWASAEPLTPGPSPARGEGRRT